MAKSNYISSTKDEPKTSEKGKLVKEGLLGIKFPAGSKERKLSKAWQSRWVLCVWKEFPPALEMQICSGQKPPSNGQLIWTVSISPDGGLVYRSRSRTHPWAFSVAHDGLVLLHFAGDKEAISQSWMAVMRDFLWPPSPLAQLEEAFKDTHRVSLIDNETTCLTEVFAAFGHLHVAEDVVSLHSTHGGHLIKEWNLDDFTGVEMIRNDGVDATSGVLVLNFKKGVFSHGHSLQFYSQTATSIVQIVSSALKIRQTKRVDDDLGASTLKYESGIQELSDLFSIKESDPTREDLNQCIVQHKLRESMLPNGSYLVTETGVDSLQNEQLADIVSHLHGDSKEKVLGSTFSSLEPYTYEDISENTAFDSSNACFSESEEAKSENSKHEHSETWMKLSDISGDFLNCSINSFILRNNPRGGSNSSENSSEYSPPVSPTQCSSVDKDETFYSDITHFRRSSCISTASNLYAEVAYYSKRPSIAETVYEEVEDFDIDEVFQSSEDIYMPPLPPPRENKLNGSPQLTMYNLKAKRPSTLCLEGLSSSIAETLSQIQSQTMPPKENGVKIVEKTSPGWFKPIKGVKKILVKDKKLKSPQVSPLEEKVKYGTQSEVRIRTFSECNNIIQRDNCYPLMEESHVNFGEADSSEKNGNMNKILNEPFVPFPTQTYIFGEKQLPIVSQEYECLMADLPSSVQQSAWTSSVNRKLTDSKESKQSCLQHFLQTLASRNLQDGIYCSCSQAKQDQFSHIKANYNQMHSKSFNLEIKQHLNYLADCTNGAISSQESMIQKIKETTEGATLDITNSDCDTNSLIKSCVICRAAESSANISLTPQAEEPSYMNMKMVLK